MLANALDCGVSEFDFWNMTFAELDRVVESHNRKAKREAQERASFDYIHAVLIGKAFAKCMSSSADFPDLYEAYSHVFDKAQPEERQNKQDELSAIRFMQFAKSHNEKLKKGVAKNNE
jgi:hypothetical protein